MGDKSKLPAVQSHGRQGVITMLADGAIARWVPQMRDGDTGETVIDMLEQIGDDGWSGGVTARRVEYQLQAAQGRDVTVVINSPGGSYFEGLAIYNLLRGYSGKVTVKIVGVAASAAAVIAMAGDDVLIGRAAFLMIHNAQIVAGGDRHSLRSVADWMEPFDAAGADIFQARTGLRRGDVIAMLDRERWISSGEAIAEGFADGLLPADDGDVSLKQSTSVDIAQVRAEKQIDKVFQMAGKSRGDARSVIASLKSTNPRGAGGDGVPGATDEVADLLSAFLQSL